jgi:hypothetical protein
MPQIRYGIQNQVVEWSYASGKTYKDPFNEVELDVEFTNDKGQQWKMPAFWSGGHEWRIRFAAPEPGTYHYSTVCSDKGNCDLHNQEGLLEVQPYTGDNELLQHGHLKTSRNNRFIEHSDGTPFFWLGDTWWMCLSKRLSWPEEFQILTADRKEKGFNVIQLVAGLYPDMPAFDKRGANEAGFPWNEGYGQINPEYFDMMDLRISWLVKSGLVPCILGCWGYHLLWLGADAMKKHWRNLIARYGAYPVVWCLGGELAMPFYLATDAEKDKELLKKGWVEVGMYVRSIDPYHSPLSAHATHFSSSRDQVEDPSIMDFDMPQAGHGMYSHAPAAAKRMVELINITPRIPVVNSEVIYDGIFEVMSPLVQRFLFWSTMLSGAAGHTYGANGLWQFNSKDDQFGPSPHGANWGDTLWQDAYRFPGSAHIGIGKKLLEKYEWWNFEPHQEWVEPAAGDDNYSRPYAAGIPGEVRIFYFPEPVFPWIPPVYIKEFESDADYTGYFFNPKDGSMFPLGNISPGADGKWKLPLPPLMQDWVLLMEKT